MTISKHTPGPWRFGESGDTFVCGPDGQTVAVTDGMTAPLPNNREEALANARLIRAAPDMLCVLKQIREHVVNGDQAPVMIRTMIDAVIFNAEERA
jgi:hypothetical protein